jgi:hypothetical protein
MHAFADSINAKLLDLAFGHGGFGWLRPDRNRSGRQEAGPKADAAEDKMPCCADCSSADREADGN